MVISQCHSVHVFGSRFAVLTGLTSQHESMHSKLKSSRILKVALAHNIFDMVILVPSSVWVYFNLYSCVQYNLMFCSPLRSIWTVPLPSEMMTPCVSTCSADGAMRWDKWLYFSLIVDSGLIRCRFHHPNEYQPCEWPRLKRFIQGMTLTDLCQQCVCVCAGSHSGLAGEEGGCCPLPEPPHHHTAWRPRELPQGSRLL